MEWKSKKVLCGFELSALFRFTLGFLDATPTRTKAGEANLTLRYVLFLGLA